MYITGWLELVMQTKLAWNSQESTCVGLLNAGTKGVCHLIQLQLEF